MERRVLLGAALCCVFAACGESPKGKTFYERKIEPILVQTCAGNTSGCHSTNEGDPFAIAAGNFDVTSFENVQKRRDVLTSFGVYPFPLLLIKAVGPGKLQFNYGTPGVPKTIDVQHSGGGLVEVGSDAYFTLQGWLDNGATENGLRPATPPVTGQGGCTDAPPQQFVPSFDPAAVQSLVGYDSFKANIQPIIDNKGCNAASCHGAPQSDFFLLCGKDESQLAFNFSQAWAFLNDPVDDSQLLRVPLNVNSGSRFHTGGSQFASVDDADFQTFKTWAAQVVAAPPAGNGVRDFAGTDAAKIFFRDNVQPILVQRGCQFQACHSPQATNDFKLRSGFIGFFSSVALERNYSLLRDEFMAIEYPDARRGRAVAKAILDDDPRVAGPAGIVHRGGSVLETPGIPADPDPSVCTSPAVSAFCTVQAWLAMERAASAEVSNMDVGQTIPIVYVERPAGSVPGRLDDLAFAANAELRVVNATFQANQRLAPINDGAATVLSASCGLAGGDIRTPSVAPDGDRVAFAGRASAGDRLGIYIAKISTGECQRLMPANTATNGALEAHDFDPVFSPDGTYVVFASTRGKTGPTASRKTFKVQSDLWRVPVTGIATSGAPEQMTFLSNSELAPGFMREGRVTMTTEKVSDGFYQLSGRRINWDLTDYHPLLAQRRESRFADSTMQDLTATKPSIGFSSAVDIREASDGDFLLILSDANPDGSPGVPRGAGALGIFNRSIGPFEQGREDVGYVKSLRLVGDPAATGAAGSTAGYRRPFSLPDGTIMAAFSANATAGTFDIHAVDPRTTNDLGSIFDAGPGGNARVDAVMAYRYPARALYANRRQLVFGGAVDQSPDSAIVYMPDAPMVFTVLVANLRRGRPLAEFDKATQLVVYEEAPCGTTCTPNTASGIFEMRTQLGAAPLASDGSVKVALPASRGLVFELQDSSGNSIAKMTEEHQLGPGERVSMGVSRTLFNGVCGGCHGSISAQELDVAVTPDALTSASASAVQFDAPATPR